MSGRVEQKLVVDGDADVEPSGQGKLESFQEEYRPDRYTRENGIGPYLDTIIQRSSNQSALVHLQAVQGGGKTWLLLHLAHRYPLTISQQANDIFPTPANQDPKAVYLELSPQTASPTAIIHEVFKALSDAQLLDEDEKNDEQMSTEKIRGLTEKYRLVFLFDIYGLITQEQWDEIHRDVYAQLLGRSGTVIIQASKEKMSDVVNSDVRNCVEEIGESQDIAIPPLSVIQVEEVLHRAQVAFEQKDLATLLMFSAGHPLLTRAVVEMVVTWQHSNPGKDLESFFESSKPELTQLLVTLKDEIFDGELESDVPMLEKLAQVRWIGTSYFEALLNTDDSREWNNAQWGKVFSNLKARSKLLHWGKRVRAYVVNPTVRRVLNQIQFLTDPEATFSTNSKALEVMREFAEEYAENCHDVILEILFHLANIARVNNEMNLRDQVNEWIDFARDNLSSDNLSKLSNEFKADYELRLLFPPEIWTMIDEQLSSSLENEK